MTPTLLLVAAAIVQGPAVEPRAADVMSALRTCREITPDAERLACFDRAATALISSVERKDVIVTDRQEVREARRSLFGFAVPATPILDNDTEKDREGEANEAITSTLASANKLRNGYVRFVLKEGAVWQTTEAVGVTPKVGTEVTVEKALFGSYRVRFRQGRAYRAMRVQ